jgi:hypothetical protein
MSSCLDFLPLPVIPSSSAALPLNGDEKPFEITIKDLGEYDNSCVSPQQLYHLLLWNKDKVEKVGRDGVLITDNFPYTEFPLWRYLIRGRAVWMPQEVFDIKQTISATDR